MQLRFLTLVLFFLFPLCITSFAPKKLLSLQHEGFNISKAIIQEQEAQCKNGLQRVEGGRAEMRVTIRKSRGRSSGAYGGANIVRRPRPQSSALTLSPRGYPILCLTFALILVSVLWF